MTPEYAAAMLAGLTVAGVIFATMLPKHTPPPISRMTYAYDNDGRLLAYPDPGTALNPTNYATNRAWLAAHGITDPCPCQHPWPTHKPDPGIGCTTTGCLCLTPTAPPPRMPRAPRLQPDPRLLTMVTK